MNTLNWESEHIRFMSVAYPRIVKAATHAFWQWKSNKRPDAIQESICKAWDSWSRLLLRGRDPEPLLAGIIKYALLWTRYDRKIAGRSRMPDISDYRANMRQQLLSEGGQASPSDRADPANPWINWTLTSGDSPADLAAALESSGVSLAQWCDL
jgi:hypothetical protein